MPPSSVRVGRTMNACLSWSLLSAPLPRRGKRRTAGSGGFGRRGAGDPWRFRALSDSGSAVDVVLLYYLVPDVPIVSHSSRRLRARARMCSRDRHGRSMQDGLASEVFQAKSCNK